MNIPSPTRRRVARQERPAAGLLGWRNGMCCPMRSCATASAAVRAAACRGEAAGGAGAAGRRFSRRIDMLRDSPVAIHADAANAQHYELPPAFFEQCLGKRLKYSGCYYPRGDESLDQAEEAMLELYGERAELADGQRHPRARLRLGFAHAVDGRTLPERDDRRRLQLEPAARVHRGPVPAARLFNVRVITGT